MYEEDGWNRAAVDPSPRVPAEGAFLSLSRSSLQLASGHRGHGLMRSPCPCSRCRSFYWRLHPARCALARTSARSPPRRRPGVRLDSALADSHPVRPPAAADERLAPVPHRPAAPNAGGQPGPAQEPGRVEQGACSPSPPPLARASLRAARCRRCKPKHCDLVADSSTMRCNSSSARCGRVSRPRCVVFCSSSSSSADRAKPDAFSPRPGQAGLRGPRAATQGRAPAHLPRSVHHSPRSPPPADPPKLTQLSRSQTTAMRPPTSLRPRPRRPRSSASPRRARLERLAPRCASRRRRTPPTRTTDTTPTST